MSEWVVWPTVHTTHNTQKYTLTAQLLGMHSMYVKYQVINRYMDIYQCVASRLQQKPDGRSIAEYTLNKPCCFIHAQRSLNSSPSCPFITFRLIAEHMFGICNGNVYQRRLVDKLVQSNTHVVTLTTRCRISTAVTG